MTFTLYAEGDECECPDVYSIEIWRSESEMTAAKKKRLGEFVEPDASQDIIVAVGFQTEGVTYRLHPTSADRIRQTFPGVRVAPSVYVGYTTRDEFEALHGPMWPQIVILLTGVDADKLQEKFPRLVLWDPASGRQWVNVNGDLREVT